MRQITLLSTCRPRPPSARGREFALRQFSRLLAADRGRGSWQQDGEAEDEGDGGEGEAQH